MRLFCKKKKKQNNKKPTILYGAYPKKYTSIIMDMIVQNIQLHVLCFCVINYKHIMSLKGKSVTQ